MTKKTHNPFLVEGLAVEGFCRENSFYVRFTDEDIDELLNYAFDLGYSLEPEIIAPDPEHPIRFKIISKTSPSVYGWVSKIVEKTEDQWQDAFLYGFYRHGSFRNKYPITFNIQSRLMRHVIKHNADKNPKQRLYFRTLFGILDLESEVNPMDFILSWLWSVKFHHI